MNLEISIGLHTDSKLIQCYGSIDCWWYIKLSFSSKSNSDSNDHGSGNDCVVEPVLCIKMHKCVNAMGKNLMLVWSTVAWVNACFILRLHAAFAAQITWSFFYSRRVCVFVNRKSTFVNKQLAALDEVSTQRLKQLVLASIWNTSRFDGIIFVHGFSSLCLWIAVGLSCRKSMCCGARVGAPSLISIFTIFHAATKTQRYFLAFAKQSDSHQYPLHLGQVAAKMTSFYRIEKRGKFPLKIDICWAACEFCVWAFDTAFLFYEPKELDQFQHLSRLPLSICCLLSPSFSSF